MLTADIYTHPNGHAQLLVRGDDRTPTCHFLHLNADLPLQRDYAGSVRDVIDSWTRSGYQRKPERIQDHLTAVGALAVEHLRRGELEPIAHLIDASNATTHNWLHYPDNARHAAHVLTLAAHRARVADDLKPHLVHLFAVLGRGGRGVRCTRWSPWQ